MESSVLHQYMKRYFEANGAEILQDDNKRLKVQLTEELDKELMNRPFYWQYVNKTGGFAQPMTLTFIKEGEKEKNERAEHLHFGSPRLHQIFQSSKQRGKWTILYEETDRGPTPSPLYPWLIVNIKVSFTSHQRKDIIHSCGLQLIHGQVVENMMDHLNQKPLNKVIPAHSFPMNSLIQVNSGLRRLKRYTETKISEEPKEWAEKAEGRMEEELNTLNAYYESSSQPQEEYEQEKEAILERYTPKVYVSLINAGLVYLSNSSF